MAASTEIEWTDATWNPVTGCTKITRGCDLCYAERFSERFRGVPSHPFENGFDLKLRPERLAQPLGWRQPRRIFVNSMSDLFHKEIPWPFPYISLDKSGRYLFGASYSGNLISVNAVKGDGSVASEPLQVIPVGRNAHSIRSEASNKFAFVPTLGSNEIFQFTFDAKTGRLASNTPAVFLMKPGFGPRHFITSSDNKFVYVLSELTGAVTTFSLDGKKGLLTEVSSASGLPPDSKLVPGAPRGGVGVPGGPPPRNTDNDVWAADLHLTPNGKFLYMTERTSSSLTTFSVDGASGKLTYVTNTPTEKQPRGFAIDPKGKFMVVSGEKSDTISAYRIDEASGGLTLVGKYPAGKDANWVEIVSFD